MSPGQKSLGCPGQLDVHASILGRLAQAQAQAHC